jgi:endonuclease/exonuclease/phosphatase (EEP) superfamily protein YafD
MAHSGWPIRLAIAATAIACVLLVAAFAAALVPIWPCALFEHFRAQYVVTGTLLVVATAALGMRGYFDVAAVTTALHLLWIAPDLCRAPRAIPANGAPVRVLALNVHTEGSRFDEVRQLIEDVHPDVVGLVEVDERWLRGVAPAVAQFAGRIEQPRADNFGVALYTRGPLVGSIEELGTSLPSAVGSVSIGGASFSIVLIHPLPPVAASSLVVQREELDAVAERVHSLSGPVVVMGDFNATPWSRPYRRLLAASGLCDSRAGFGIQATYPAASAVVRIPIDHLLASCSIGIADRRVERDVGSDHLPVVIDLVVPRSAR